MTDAEQAMTDKFKSLPENQIREIAKITYARACNGDDDASVINDFALAALGWRLTDRDFIAFCEELEGVPNND